MYDTVAPQLMTRTDDTNAGFDVDSTETDEFHCVGFELTDGGGVIYDPANHCAWIQSDTVHDIRTLL